MLLDVVVCDFATLICVKVQRWDREQSPTSITVTVTTFHLLRANAGLQDY
jgi:hypothetical protein